MADWRISGLVLLLLAPSALAQPLHVTSWNLQPPANTNTIRVPAAAAALKRLDPDVILLQQVTDRATCEALAEALKPAAYNVVICSAFRDARTGALRKQQVAILAKADAKPYFSSSEAWRNRGGPALPGGLAFAALEVGSQRVGVFSIQAGGPPAAGKKKAATSLGDRQTATIEQLLAKVGSVSNWVANQVQVFVVGGTFGLGAGENMALKNEPLQRLQDAGFGDAFQDVAAAERATIWAKPGQVGPTTDYLFARPATRTANPAVLHVAAARHYPLSCEVAPAPPAPAAEQPARSEPAPAPVPAPAPSQPEPPAAAKDSPSSNSSQLLRLSGALGGIIALALGVWILARRRKSLSLPTPALLTDGGESPSGYTVVMGTQSATESTSTNRRPAPAPRPLIHIEAPGDTQTQTEDLRQRTLAAEQRAERANAVIRAGLLPQLSHLLKLMVVRKLMTDRTQLLETQKDAALKALAVEQRLARIEQQLQQQNRAYEHRIEELTQLLAVAKEENRELIRARIAQVKAEMEAARAKLMAQSEPGQDSAA